MVGIGPQQHRRGVGGRQHGLGLDPLLELLVQPFDRVGGPRTLPLFRRQAGEAEQACASFLEAVGNGTMFDPPFTNESLATRLDLLACFRIDHIVVARVDFLMQAFRCMRKQVPVLVHLVTLHLNVPVQDRLDDCAVRVHM